MVAMVAMARGCALPACLALSLAWAGACGAQYTANTMATVLEFMGLSAMGTATVGATDPRKESVGERTGRLAMDLLQRGVLPRDLITRKSLENGIICAASTGGSTNVVLHLLAIAREAGVELDIDDFDRISEQTPLIEIGRAHV